MKSTRGFYRRKIFLFGLFIFISIALISTGFAAWVMSTNATSNQQGNINVGTVTDAQIKIENVNLSNPDFKFEPQEGDTNGRVRYDGKNAENLEITLTATITPPKYLSNVKVELKLPQGVADAVSAGYLSYKGGTQTAEAVSPTGYVYELTPEEQQGTNYQLSVTLAFEWGTKFGGKNPGLYYDEDPVGQAVSDTDMKKTLEDFRVIIFNYDEEFNAPSANRDEIIKAHENDTLKFDIKITASIN